MKSCKFLALVILGIVLGWGAAHAEYNGDAGLGVETFNYQKLLDVLDASQPSTVKDALNVLKKAYPDYFAYYTLVYESFSLQQASFQSPRALVFGRDARLVLAFNDERIGSLHSAGSDSLELVRFDDARKQFEFRQIVFRDEFHPSDDPYPSKAPYTVSQANSTLNEPGRCTLCHGAQPRPNWEEYPVWPGVYGSIDDFIDGNLTQSREFKEYLEFKKSAPNRDRYSVLAAVGGTSRPNHDLGILFDGLNAQRAVNILLHNPQAMKSKYAILYALACNPEISTQVIQDNGSSGSHELVLELPKSPLTSLEEDTRDQIVDNHVMKIERISQLTGIPLKALYEPFSDFALTQAAKIFGFPANELTRAYAASVVGMREILAVAKLRQILEPLGIDVGNWSLPLGGKSYVFDEPSNNGVNIQLRLNFGKPFLAAAFDGPEDANLRERFSKWMEPKLNDDPPSADEIRDCENLSKMN